MTKRLPDGGPQLDGEEPHFAYGRGQVHPGDHFDYHLVPFKEAPAAGTSQMMPYYGMPIGTEHEEVAFGFNRGIITGLLRERLGFDGIVCTDWGLISDANIVSQAMPARAWGVEELSVPERMPRVPEAGCDRFGGEHVPEKNDAPEGDTRGGEPILPAAEGSRVYVRDLDAEVAAGYGTVVATPEEADVAIVRVETSFESREGGFEQFFHAGSLEFDAVEPAAILELCATARTRSSRSGTARATDPSAPSRADARAGRPTHPVGRPRPPRSTRTGNARHAPVHHCRPRLLRVLPWVASGGSVWRSPCTRPPGHCGGTGFAPWR
ncbi:hypothetical protein ACFRCG_08670 [Embleya sp. NPDC056575]|uniref:hypothetical protein n=1 Tax=unclassified Embleya TaxID=2699296 RepID=UPI0036B106E8